MVPPGQEGRRGASQPHGSSYARVVVDRRVRKVSMEKRIVAARDGVEAWS